MATSIAATGPTGHRANLYTTLQNSSHAFGGSIASNGSGFLATYATSPPPCDSCSEIYRRAIAVSPTGEITLGPEIAATTTALVAANGNYLTWSRDSALALDAFGTPLNEQPALDALWDAFSTTPQPTFGAIPRPGQTLAALVPMSITIGETGWQTAIPPSSQGAYFGKENVKVTSEANQAQVYTELVRTAGCDPDLRSVLIFELQDEPDLDRFQAGLLRADGTKKPSFQAMKNALAQTHGACAAGREKSWSPTTTACRYSTNSARPCPICGAWSPRAKSRTPHPPPPARSKPLLMTRA